MPIVLLPEAGAGAYVTLDDLRLIPNLAGYSDDQLAQASEWFETIFEDHTRMAFVPRSATERLSGSSPTLALKHWPVRSITAVRSYTTATVSTAFTATELSDLLIEPTGYVRRYTGSSWPIDVEVDYTHGQLAPPADVKEAAKVAISEHLMQVSSQRPADRTYGVANDGVFVRNILPGENRPFGIAEVDEVANRYRARYWVPAVA